MPAVDSNSAGFAMRMWCHGALFARFTSLSALVILLVTTLLLATEGLNFAVDFVGGMIMEVHYSQAVESKSVQDTLVHAGFADASVKEISGYPSHFFIAFPLTDEVLSAHTGPLVVQRVLAALHTEQSLEASRIVIVSPTKIGGDLLLLGS